MPHYKSNSEVEKEFEKKFTDNGIWPHVSPKEVFDYFLSLRQADRQAVRLETLEEVEGCAPEGMLISKDFTCVCDYGDPCHNCRNIEWNACRSEFLSNITKLKEIQK